MGHGSHLNADSSAPVYAHADAMRARGGFAEVRVGFWKEEPSLSRALDAFDSEDVTVVPVFISEGYFTNEVIPREMRLSGAMNCVDGRRVRYTKPIGGHPSLARVIVQRAMEAGAKGTEALAVLGHGTPRNARSEENVLRQAQYVRDLGCFPEVATIFLDQEPNMRDVFELVANESIVRRAAVHRRWLARWRDNPGGYGPRRRGDATRRASPALRSGRRHASERRGRYQRTG